jgi:hypothetical protein
VSDAWANQAEGLPISWRCSPMLSGVLFEVLLLNDVVQLATAFVEAAEQSQSLFIAKANIS